MQSLLVVVAIGVSAVAVAFAVAVVVAFQLPVERAVTPGPEAGKVRRLSERSAA